MTAADHANTGRETLARMKLEADALPLGDLRTAWRDDIASVSAALDALQAQAEVTQEAIQDAKYVGFEAMRERAEAAEAERDRARENAGKVIESHARLIDERDRLADALREIKEYTYSLNEMMEAIIALKAIARAALAQTEQTPRETIVVSPDPTLRAYSRNRTEHTT